MFDLSGKTALVTGATGGIGEAIARNLHKQGAEVALSGRNTDKLNALAKELGERAHVVPADLGAENGPADLAKAAGEALGGKVDILVNNAGLTRDGLSMRMKEDDWNEVINVNMTATFKLAQALQRGMMKNRFGRVINITSVVGVTGNPGQTNYCASKAGMIGWSKSMAAEVASRGITVNCVAPGFIATAMTEVLTDDQKDGINKNIPMQRMGGAEDIAAACSYLASDEAGYVTGQTIHVNGGMAMI
ncbi:MAG: 3-oxoacyl-[acyl-carrier-protein] reductase [Pseudomonadota bacterium]|jgi:3-oxoacyl-[acyl-carrier protein] reductase|nr:3-oxoacyl-[acyl-carrier-protein] reductase [Pseudomonadota bacterium]MEC9236530.1 3-oxoacyl-[acyl-carrier-protein] reductase [Pseudomonadota bacterium]MED5423203.1 3-oxoacyl-[acyl-carrier-protein] reductase [Pseudomonadota bacterium]